MQVQLEYTLRFPKYKQLYDVAADDTRQIGDRRDFQRRGRCCRHSVGVRPDQRRNARVKALEFA